MHLNKHLKNLNLKDHPTPKINNYFIRLLPKSFNGKDIENLEIFLEKCEFVVSNKANWKFPANNQIQNL